MSANKLLTKINKTILVLAAISMSAFMQQANAINGYASMDVVLVNGSGAPDSFFAHYAGDSSMGTTAMIPDGGACVIQGINLLGGDNVFYIQTVADGEGAYNALWAEISAYTNVFKFASDFGQWDSTSSSGWGRFYGANAPGSPWPTSWTQAGGGFQFEGGFFLVAVGSTGSETLSNNTQPASYYLQQYNNNSLPNCF